jgi:hypothetical protein
LARGDLSFISELMAELLDRFGLNLDPQSAAYRKLGLAVLRAEVRALEALDGRAKGEVVETPPMAGLEPPTSTGPQASQGPVQLALPKGDPTLQAADASLRLAFEG